jgi:phage shock protein PspC (stress-responsive transcriptional regulator)
MARESGELSEPEQPDINQTIGNSLFSCLARSLLNNRHRDFANWSRMMNAQENQVALPLRPHTILGVCEAIGEDFGFNPIFLRVPFAATVLVSPLWSIVAYFALGAVVLASRLLFPKPKATKIDGATSAQQHANEQQEYAKAA